MLLIIEVSFFGRNKREKNLSYQSYNPNAAANLLVAVCILHKSART